MGMKKSAALIPWPHMMEVGVAPAAAAERALAMALLNAELWQNRV